MLTKEIINRRPDEPEHGALLAASCTEVADESVDLRPKSEPLKPEGGGENSGGKPAVLCSGRCRARPRVKVGLDRCLEAQARQQHLESDAQLLTLLFYLGVAR